MLPPAAEFERQHGSCVAPDFANARTTRPQATHKKPSQSSADSFPGGAPITAITKARSGAVDFILLSKRPCFSLSSATSRWASASARDVRLPTAEVVGDQRRHVRRHKNRQGVAYRAIGLLPAISVVAGAALEASANEQLQDVLDHPAQFQMDESHKKLGADLKDERSGNALTKFRRLALLMSRDPDTGTKAWENARLLIEFRNAFMHFRPAWNDDAIHDAKFVRNLASSQR
jgi:hypothetical protein